MEKGEEKTLCRIRDIYRSIAIFELNFEGKYNICLNEGMLLCSLQDNQYSSSQLAEALGLTNSNASKVIRSLEQKGLIERNIGADDKRQMYFSLSEKGKLKLANIRCEDMDLPEILKTVVKE